jgi:hypothetical protein
MVDYCLLGILAKVSFLWLMGEVMVLGWEIFWGNYF